MNKRTEDLQPGDVIITEDNELHKVKLTYSCPTIGDDRPHMRIVTDTDTIGFCEDNDVEWEIAPWIV